MIGVNCIKNAILSIFIALAVSFTLADSPTASPPEKFRYFVEYLQDDTGPVTVSGWQQLVAGVNTQSAATGTKQTQTIDLSYSGAGWSMSLCPRARIADVSGLMTVQKANNGGYRIYPATPTGEFSLGLSAGSVWPEGCAAIHFHRVDGGAHALELNNHLLIPEQGFQWQQKQQKKERLRTEEKSWISVSLPRAEPMGTSLVIPGSLLSSVLAQRANETGSMPMATLDSVVPKKSRDSSGSFGVDDNPSPFPFQPPGHPKEAMFDIDLSLLYESATDEEEEFAEAWGEISFFSVAGEERSVILPIELIRQWLDDPQAESAEFWRAILTGCREQGCDELFHTLALIHRSGKPRGEDQNPEAEPFDMLPSGGARRSRSSFGGAGSSAAGHRWGSRDQSTGEPSQRQAGQGDGSGTPPAAQLTGLPNWGGYLSSFQFTLLELAYEIRGEWQQVATSLGVTRPNIEGIVRVQDSDHMKAYKMLRNFLGSKGANWSLSDIHDRLNSQGQYQLADKCKEVAVRKPPSIGPGFSYGQIFPRTGSIRRVIQAPLLVGLYLGLSHSEYHGINQSHSQFGPWDVANEMLARLTTSHGQSRDPERLPRLVLAAYRTSQLQLLDHLPDREQQRQASQLVGRIESDTFFQPALAGSSEPAATAPAGPLPTSPMQGSSAARVPQQAPHLFEQQPTSGSSAHHAGHSQPVGAAIPSPHQLRHLPAWEGQLSQNQFILLELAYEIREEWVEVATVLKIPTFDIRNQNQAIGSSFLKAYKMLQKFMAKSRWSLEGMHNYLAHNGKPQLAEKCRELAVRTLPSMAPEFSYMDIFPDRSLLTMHMQEPLLLGLYFGMSHGQVINNIEKSSPDRDMTKMARDMIAKLKTAQGRTLQPEGLPRLVLAAFRTNQLQLISHLPGEIQAQANVLVDQIRSDSFFQPSIAVPGEPVPALPIPSASLQPAIQRQTTRPDFLDEAQWQALAGMPVPPDLGGWGDFANAQELVEKYAQKEWMKDFVKHLLSTSHPAAQVQATAGPGQTSLQPDMSELDCSVCMDPLHDAVSLPECGHTFCEACAFEFREECPICRNPVTRPPVPNWTVRKFMRELMGSESGPAAVPGQPAVVQSLPARSVPSQPVRVQRQHPIDREPSERDLRMIAQNYVTSIEELSVFLGITSQEDAAIRKDHSHDYADRKYYTLHKVKSKCEESGQHFFRELLQAALDAHNRRLFDDVCNYLGVNSKDVVGSFR